MSVEARIRALARRWELTTELQEALLKAAQAKRATAPVPPRVDTWFGTDEDETSDSEATFQDIEMEHATPSEARYEDLGLIGVGARGEVRRVRDEQLDRVVAMKVLRSDLISNRAVVARFVEEARVTAGLAHPGIIPVHEIGKREDGRYYYTMKEVQGRTLYEVIKAVHKQAREGQSIDGTWNFRRLISVFERLCDAVAYAHSRGVVHRDLKPDNLMVGAFGEVVVLDWGLAMRYPAESTVGTRVAGTPAYMPPEQARGELQTVGPRWDVYALGAILYHILSGRVPYDGDHREAVRRLLAGPPAPVGRVVDKAYSTDLAYDGGGEALVPGVLQMVCERAMSRAAADRYRDAGRLGREISAFLQGARRRERALELVFKAEHLEPEIGRLRARCAQLRAEATEALDPIQPHESADRKAPAWRLMDEAQEMERESWIKDAQAMELLKAALSHVPDLREAHQKLAQRYRERHVSAETRRDAGAAAEAEASLRAHDTGEHEAYLRGTAQLSLQSNPPASATLHRFVERGRRLELDPVRELGPEVIRSVELPVGSYVVELVAPGCATVLYPVALNRLEDWDGVGPEGGAPQPVPLLRSAALERDDVYVPVGWFQCGGDSGAPNSLRLQRRWLPAFVIRRFPVTNLEYIQFLNDLVAQGRDDEAESFAPREKSGIADTDGALIYGRDARGRFALRPDEDGDMWQGDWPVFQVDWFGASAYARWLAEGSDLPWRLPGELEWEKAARGVDGRGYPWGDFLDPTWCSMRESHAERPLPAVVDSYPIDRSPYGVRGLAGNVRDWCEERYHPSGPGHDDAHHGRVVRGGCWSFAARQARSANRDWYEPHYRHSYLGFRVARDLVPADLADGSPS